MKVMRDERLVTVEVTADGAGLVSHAGTRQPFRARSSVPVSLPYRVVEAALRVA